MLRWLVPRSGCRKEIDKENTHIFLSLDFFLKSSKGTKKKTHGKFLKNKDSTLGYVFLLSNMNVVSKKVGKMQMVSESKI